VGTLKPAGAAPLRYLTNLPNPISLNLYVDFKTISIYTSTINMGDDLSVFTVLVLASYRIRLGRMGTPNTCSVS